MQNQSPLSILEIGTTDTKGGAALVSWQLKQQLESQGNTVSMVVGYKRSKDKQVRKIFDTPINRFISRLVGRDVRSRLHQRLVPWLANDITLLPGKKIIHWSQFKNADLVHAHNLHSGFFNLKALPALSQQKPFVWTLHDMWALTGYQAYSFECAHWQTKGCDCHLNDTLQPLKWCNTKHLWRLKRRIYQKSKLHIVVPSHWLASMVRKSMLRDQPLTVIYNGVDHQTFKPAADVIALRGELNLPLNKTIVLFSNKGGKKFYRKGWQHIQPILNRYRYDPRIAIVCLGGYGDRAEANDAITYVDYISEPTLLAKYYAASDFLLYPSLADNCPLTILEALACGLPVLAFSTGGIPELIIHKKTGYVAEYKNATDLVSGFDYLCSLSKKDMDTMRATCRHDAEARFSLSRMVDEYLKLYRRLTQ